MIGTKGESFDDVERYIAHVLDRLPEAYRASLDVSHWVTQQRGVADGTITLKDAVRSMPRLARVGGACPCANSVRWVMDVGASPPGGAPTLHP